MSSPFNYPRFKAFDSNGVPLAGGLLYTYGPGTDTPLTVYEDYEFSTPHANPIELDANGEALIYSKTPFKGLLTDADGATIDGWPIDNIEVPPYHSYLLLGPIVPATPPTNVVALYADGTSFKYKDSSGTINSLISSAGIQVQAYTSDDAGGSANALTATFLPTITALTDKLRVTVTSSAANTGAVTFAPDSLTAKPVVNRDGNPLVAGDIPAANIPVDLQYVLALDSWVLMGVAPVSKDSATKFWVEWQVNGTILASYNVASVTDTGTGDWTVNVATDFSSANFVALSNALDSAADQGKPTKINAIAAGTVQVKCFVSDGSTKGDPDTGMFAAGWGDQ